MKTSILISLMTAALSQASPIASPSPAGSPKIVRQSSVDNTTVELMPREVTLRAINSDAPFHEAVVNAYENAFYINLGLPSTSCPMVKGLQHYNCPPGNMTVITIGTSGASMYSDVPGGQPVFVPPRTGNLSYTAPHAEGDAFKDEDTETGFSYTLSDANNETSARRFRFNGNNSRGWLACPVPASMEVSRNGSVWQVYASVDWLVDSDVVGKNVSACVSTELEAVPFVGLPNAFEYV